MEATRPQGVRIQHADGRITICELSYAGETDDGTHEWHAISPIADGDQVQIDMLPARSTLLFPMNED